MFILVNYLIVRQKKAPLDAVQCVVAVIGYDSATFSASALSARNRYRLALCLRSRIPVLA